MGRKLRLIMLGLIALTALSYPAEVLSKTRPGWKLVWQEEFRGRKLKDDVWTRIPRYPNPSEWNKYMSTDDRLFRVRRGRLTLYGRTNDYLPQDTAHYLTGGISSRGKKLFHRGRIDIRLRMDDAQGAWPAAWLLPEGKWPDDGEIDIMERLNYDSVAYQTVHSCTTEYDTLGRKTQPWGITAPIRKGKWNVYSVELSEDSMKFFINNRPTFTYRRQPEMGPDQYPYDRPMYMLIDMQLGAYWLGKINPEELPYRYQIDYVRYYKKESEEGQKESKKDNKKRK